MMAETACDMRARLALHQRWMNICFGVRDGTSQKTTAYLHCIDTLTVLVRAADAYMYCMCCGMHVALLASRDEIGNSALMLAWFEDRAISVRSRWTTLTGYPKLLTGGSHFLIIDNVTIKRHYLFDASIYGIKGTPAVPKYVVLSKRICRVDIFNTNTSFSSHC